MMNNIKAAHDAEMKRLQKAEAKAEELVRVLEKEQKEMQYQEEIERLKTTEADELNFHKQMFEKEKNEKKEAEEKKAASTMLQKTFRNYIAKKHATTQRQRIEKEKKDALEVKQGTIRAMQSKLKGSNKELRNHVFEVEKTHDIINNPPPVKDDE
jgi:hypothetical protein